MRIVTDKTKTETDAPYYAAVASQPAKALGCEWHATCFIEKVGDKETKFGKS